MNMKKLAIIFLCLILTGCTYLGRTDAIRISSPNELAISRIETFGEVPLTTPEGVTTTAATTLGSEVTATPTVTEDHPAPPDTPASTTASITTTAPVVAKQLILSLNTKKIHYFDTCSYAKKIKPENRKVVDGKDEALLLIEGYTVCSWCAKH